MRPDADQAQRLRLHDADDRADDGEVEVDEAAFGGHVRPANLREERADRGLPANRSGKRRIVVAQRQRGGRTLTRTFLRETDGVDFARTRIAPGAVVSADEGPHWHLLEPAFDMRRIAPADSCSRDGVHTNQAESHFSRLRRMISGLRNPVGARISEPAPSMPLG